MQRLHLVGLTEDADGLIFSTRRGAKSGGFVVTVDPDLLALLQDAQGGTAKAKTNGRGPARSPHSGGRPESLLSPREMQELLRGGWTLEEVAVEAGVDVDWVSRFAAPVMAEIRRVVDQAVEAVFDKPRVGPSALALGPSVRRNLAERGVRLTDEDFDDGWRAHQLDDVTWVVSFTYTSRGRPQEATWAIDLDADELVARNRLGTQLGHVTSIRRKVSTAPPPKPKPAASAVKRAATKELPARRAAASKARATKATKSAKAAKTAKKTAKASKTAKKKAGAAKRPAGRGKRPDVAPVTIAPVEESPPPRPNTTQDVYRDELRRRLELEAADRPRPRPPTPEPELPAVPRPRPPANRGPMPAPAPLPVPAVVREKVAAPIGTFDIEHDHKDDLDDSPFADEDWYPKVQEDEPPPRPRPPFSAHAAAPSPARSAEKPRVAPQPPAPPQPARPSSAHAAAPSPARSAEKKRVAPQPTPRPQPPAPAPPPPPPPPAPAPAPSPPPPAPPRAVRSEPLPAKAPVFRGAQPAAPQQPARPRRREPLRAR